MTTEELQQLVADVQSRASELNDLEVKAANKGTPKELYKSLSAFANRPSGGVLLFGLDENKDFDVCGVWDAQRLQEEVTHAACEMEPPLRPIFTVDEIDGKAVVAAEIDELPPSQKPCYRKAAGLNGGAYIRVGNTNRVMTDYEIFGYVSSARGQSKDDEEPVLEATLEDLDEGRLNEYLDQLRRVRPNASYLNDDREPVLKRLHIGRPIGEVFRPTLAGVLVFGKYPQEFVPQLVITFLQYYGVDETEKTPAQERFLDNRKFEGPLPALAEEAIRYILGSVRKSSSIQAVVRQDHPEYPLEAVREALLNALAHRDYSSFVRGSYIQVRLFADRLEIQSPGGLFGNVTEDNLEEEQSTRNAALMRLLEDLHLVENRGSGIKAMIEAMRQANLAPPRFEDKRSSFQVTFRNHSLLDGESTAWLNQFAALSLSDAQRLALAYLRANPRITNNDYRRLNRVDTVTAGRELRELVKAGLIEQQSAKRWTYYTLQVSPELSTSPAPVSDEARILQYAREHGDITNEQCRNLLGVDEGRAWYLLKKMSEAGSLKPLGEGRWRRYAPG